MEEEHEVPQDPQDPPESDIGEEDLVLGLSGEEYHEYSGYSTNSNMYSNSFSSTGEDRMKDF